MNKEDAIEILVAISQLEGYLIGVTGLTRPSIVYDNIDKIVAKVLPFVNKSIEDD